MNSDAPHDGSGGKKTVPSYSAVAWAIVAPVWAVGAFVLAVGLLAVPTVLLDGKGFAALSARATSKGRSLRPILGQIGPRVAMHWARLVARTPGVIPSSRNRAVETTDFGSSPRPIGEANQ